MVSEHQADCAMKIWDPDGKCADRIIAKGLEILKIIPDAIDYSACNIPKDIFAVRMSFLVCDFSQEVMQFSKALTAVRNYLNEHPVQYVEDIIVIGCLNVSDAVVSNVLELGSLCDMVFCADCPETLADIFIALYMLETAFPIIGVSFLEYIECMGSYKGETGDVVQIMSSSPWRKPELAAVKADVESVPADGLNGAIIQCRITNNFYLERIEEQCNFELSFFNGQRLILMFSDSPIEFECLIYSSKQCRVKK